LGLGVLPAQAQQRPAGQAAAPLAIPPPASAPPAQAPAASPGTQEWNSFPTMVLERIYRGPLRDTIIQRWLDPIDGTVCFLYTPISAPLLPQPVEGYVQYGANQIGSISCVHPTQVLQLWQGGNTPPPVPPPATVRRPAERER
jgi:hypothetical protein